MDDTLKLVSECINGSVSNSTLKSYQGGWPDFVVYRTENNLEPLNADHHQVMRFLAQKSIAGELYTFCGHDLIKAVPLYRLYILLSSISHHYRAAGLSSPCHHSMVKMMMKGKPLVIDNPPTNTNT